MKKIFNYLLILTLIIFTSCSSDDDGTSLPPIDQDYVPLAIEFTDFENPETNISISYDSNGRLSQLFGERSGGTEEYNLNYTGEQLTSLVQIRNLGLGTITDTFVFSYNSEGILTSIEAPGDFGTKDIPVIYNALENSYSFTFDFETKIVDLNENNVLESFQILNSNLNLNFDSTQAGVFDNVDIPVGLLLLILSDNDFNFSTNFLHPLQISSISVEGAVFTGNLVYTNSRDDNNNLSFINISGVIGSQTVSSELNITYQLKDN